MSAYSFGAIVLVAFPFTDQTTTKQRPAVVISSAAYQRERPDLIILAITSQFSATRVFGEAIVRDWQAAGLIKPSAPKPLVTAIDTRLEHQLTARAGTIHPESCALVDLS